MDEKIYLVNLETGGNQAYIFSTNKLRDIVGASELIYRVGTAYVKRAADELAFESGIPSDSFYSEKPIEDPDGPQIERIIATSGKALLLVRGEELARKFINRWSRIVALEAPGVDGIAVYSKNPVDPKAPLDKDNKASLTAVFADSARTYSRHKMASPTPGARFQRLPVVAPCSFSGRPAEGLDGDEALSKATRLQRELTHGGEFLNRISALFPEDQRSPSDDHGLDSLEDKDWIAVIHADGNGLGQLFTTFDKRVRLACGGKADGRAYINFYRSFSARLDEISHESFRSAAAAIYGDANRSETDIVPVVVGGDDLTVVINGPDALPFVTEFMRAFCAKTGNDDALSPILRVSSSDGEIRAMPRLGMCAGIVITKSHFPFSESYRLAESLMSEAKRVKNVFGPEAIALDFHILYDSVVVSKDAIRKHLSRNKIHLTAKPYALLSSIELDPGNDIGISNEMKAARKTWRSVHNFNTFLDAVSALRAKSADSNSPALPNSQSHNVRANLFAQARNTQESEWRFLMTTYPDFAKKWGNGELYIDIENDETDEKGLNSTNVEYYTYFLDALEAQRFAVGCRPEN